MTKISLSLLIIGLALGASCLLYKDTSDIYNIRMAESAIAISLWMIFSPYFSSEQIDKIYKSICLAIIVFMCFIFVAYYWLNTLVHGKAIIALEIICIALSVFVLYNLLTFFKFVFKSILDLVKKLFSAISLGQDNAFLNFLKAFTAAIIAIASFLGSITVLLNAINKFILKK